MVKLAIKRPILVIVVFIVIAIFGFLSFRQLAVEMYPKIDLPMISIVTVYPGASSVDIEEQVTKKIESAVSMVSNVKEITSTSQESVSYVTVSFEWGKDLEVAANDIRTQVEFARRSLPDDAENPIVYKFSSSMAPVAVIGMSFPMDDISSQFNITERYVLDRFRQIPGVGSAFLSSSKKEKVNVNLRIPDMVKYNVSVSQVISMIQATSMNVPLGELREGLRTYSVRLPGEYASIEDISKTIVGSSGRNPIFLYNIADIDFSAGQMNSVSRVNGKNGIVMVLQKQADANTIKVLDEVKKRIEQVKEFYPAGTEIKIIFDTSKSIKSSISNLGSTIFYGFIFVLLVVLLFLRNVRGSLIISMTIPFSLIFAFIYLFAAGDTINIISLASLSVAIGMVVDNSIVVLENIYRHRDEEKRKVKEASLAGTNEVIVAILASTLTTVAIFVPLLFIQGFSSVLFKQLAYTVSVVLFASLFVSTTLTPMLASRLIGESGKKQNRFQETTEKWFLALEQGYSNILAYALNHKKYIISVFAVLFIGSLFLLTAIKTEFMSGSEGGVVFGSVKLSQSMRIEKTDSILNQLGEEIKANYPDVENFTFYAGTSSVGGPGGRGGNQYTSTMILTFKDGLPAKTVKKNISSLRKMMTGYPEVKSADFSSGNIGAFMSSKQISLNIYGENLDNSFKTAKQIKAEMEKENIFVDITVSREDEITDISVVPVKERMMQFGMNNYFLMSSLRYGLYGTTASVYRDNGSEYDIFVSFDRKYLSSSEMLKSIPVNTPAGLTIPLSAVANIERSSQPPVIERKDQMRLITVESNLSNAPLSEANKKLDEIIKRIELPEGVRVVKGGDIESQQESFRDLLIAILIGILLVFLVMAGQFESFLDPFVIFFSIPFALTGVIWALFLTNTTLSIMGFIGMLMLVGIVVNNAIVLIDYINQLRTRGISLCDAVPLAGNRRLRPVMMTTLTTVFGLLPLALSASEGSEMWRPLGIVVIGGLLMSTLVTLVIVPVIYSIVEAKIKRTKCEIETEIKD
ncbi:MAG: efflux RND transporter permease subunit [bacterium]|nr:efflux RND transporter permease subunit [bacterium]